MNKLFYYACSALLASSSAFTAISCADNDLDNNGGAEGKGLLVRFNVNDVQEGVLSRGAMTRGAITPGLKNNDLAGAKLMPSNAQNLDVCLIETTVEGINPVKADARTRANIIEKSTLGDFSTSALRGTTASNMITNNEWFHTEKTNNEGRLYSTIYWSIEQPSARFYAIYPEKDSYQKMTINAKDETGRPSVEFEVNTDVKKQVDLMTACTGDVTYATRGIHPKTQLNFRHALTAIRFAVGQNLSWDKTIDRIELKNVLLKSKYNLPTKADGSDAAWDYAGYTQRGNAVLEGINVNTQASPNTVIIGKDDDNYIFYMIPQELTGNNITAYIHFTDNTHLEIPLKGKKWSPGTTRTYKISPNSSTWNYTLLGESPEHPAKFYENLSLPYFITSYREDPTTHEKQAVAWKVVGYDKDGDDNFSMDEKPAWLTSLSKDSGEGDANNAEECTAGLKIDAKNYRTIRNNILKNAQELGSVAQPYDLSTKGNTELRTTANSYLISAPGHYRIPLVYGNAIKDNKTNKRAYINHTRSENELMQRYILTNFLDHSGTPITEPWIEKTNGGANANIDGAYLVWSDEKPLSDIAPSLSIQHVNGDAFLDFTVTKENIESGNAVVAVTKNGTTVWSWHLWFAPEDALEKVTVTNHDNDDFDFSKETLGWNPIEWLDASYSQPRTVKVKIEQTIANNGIKQFTVINITQTPGIRRYGVSTLYQYGRKDAFPSVLLRSQIYGGHFDYNKDNTITIPKAIQNPGMIYKANDNDDDNNTWYRSPDKGGYTYLNLWAANNGSTSIEMTDRPIKTVYDPCPAGFSIPIPAAFTGFTTTGNRTTKTSEWNVDNTSQEDFVRNFGFNFWTNRDHNQTLFIPTIGSRRHNTGIMHEFGSRGKYWTAATHYQHDRVFAFEFYNYNDIESYSIPIIYTSNFSRRSFALPVRPVAEK